MVRGAQKLAFAHRGMQPRWGGGRILSPPLHPHQRRRTDIKLPHKLLKEISVRLVSGEIEDRLERSVAWSPQDVGFAWYGANSVPCSYLLIC